MRARLDRRGDRGSIITEFTLMVPVMMIATLMGLQVLTFFVASASAEHAALEGARAMSVGQDGAEVAEESVPPWLRPGTEASTPFRLGLPGLVVVRVEVPLLTGGRSERFVAEARASVPPRNLRGLIPGI